MKTDTILILDIETMDAPQASIVLEQSLVKPHANTKNFIKKEEQIAAKSKKLQESAALLDASPVPIIGGILNGKPFQFFIWDKDKPVNIAISGVGLLPCKSECDLLLCFKWLLDSQSSVTIVGHNVEKRYNGTGFDLPHLRFRYAVNGIPLPVAIDPFHTRTLDLMELYFRSSTTKKDVFVSLEEMALRLGIADKAFTLSGKDVPFLWQKGEVEACLLKNYYDLLLTQQVLSRLIS